MSSASNHELLVAIALAVAACGNGTRPAEDVPDRPTHPAPLDAAPIAVQPVAPDAVMTPKPDPELDDRLAWLYDEMGNPSAMDWLVEHSDRAHPFVRRVVEIDDGYSFGRAVVVLGRMSREEDVPLLVQRLEGMTDSGVTSILHALSEHRTDAAYEAMVELTRSDRKLVAGQAVVWLGSRGEERARAIIEPFLDHEEPDVRWSAVRGLSHLGVEPSRAKLKARRKVEKDGDVKRELDKALAK